jgi:hypothetical protein
MHMSARRLEKAVDMREDASICHLPPPARRLSGCRSVAGVYRCRNAFSRWVHGARPSRWSVLPSDAGRSVHDCVKRSFTNSGCIPNCLGAMGVSVETHHDIFIDAGWLDSLCAGVWPGRAVPVHAAATCDAAALPPVRVAEHASNTERRAARSGFEASKATGLDCA